MNPGARFFASGVVLGIASGFVAGHLVVWSRLAPTGAPSVETLPPLDLTGQIPGPSATRWSMLDQWPHETDSRLDESLGTVCDDEADEPQDLACDVQYFPAGGVDEAPLDVPVVDDEEVGIASTRSVPDSLPVTTDASPIDEETHQSEQLTRSIIEEELPHATQQEIEVWFDVLRGLAAEDVKGILRMRKHVDGLPDLQIEDGRPGFTLPPRLEMTPQEQHPDSGWGAARHVLQQARNIHGHNLANARSVGFKRLKIIWAEASSSQASESPRASLSETGGARISGTLLDMTPGRLTPTGRALDLAIVGAGFLRVRRNEDVAFTRGGHLTVNRDGRLARIQHDEEWLLDPPVVIPPDASGFEIASDGSILVKREDNAEEMSPIATIDVVTFLDPYSLQPVGGGIYLSTLQSGPPRAGSPGTNGRGELRQAMIEESNVDVPSELEALKEIEDRMARLLIPQGLVPPRIGAQPQPAQSHVDAPTDGVNR